MKGKLILKDGTIMEGNSFGGDMGRAGEVVFATGMMGYPESLTDPSYQGQILILTYPLIGNYGVPDSALWEAKNICVSGLIVSQYIDTPSHFQSTQTLGQWFENEGIPLLEIKDTRFLAQKIRDEGAQLGKIEFEKKIDWYDPNKENLVAQVSTKEIIVQEPTKNSKFKIQNAELRASTTSDVADASLNKKNNKLRTIVLIDCGAKRNIQRALLQRGVRVVTVPWDMDIFASDFPYKFDGLMISNGPGDPQTVTMTIATVKKALQKNVVTFGICLGHQILALAAGGDTKKLPYGHRSQNQPCILEGLPAGRQGTKTCLITTQNHGFAVSKIPKGFNVWFTNANDGSNEGIIHKSGRFRSVQFHPEATPGPTDAEWLFDSFLEEVERNQES